MDKQNGGLSSAEKQRETAAAIARRKVLAAYEKQGEAPTNLKSTEMDMKVTRKEWEQYHSAWQNYYQKYYSEYYSNAAKAYVATEKFKAERAKADAEDDGTIREPIEEKKIETNEAAVGAGLVPEGTIASLPNEKKEEVAESWLRKRLRTRMKEQVRHKKRWRKVVPIVAGVGVILAFLFLQYNRLIFAPIAAYVSPGENEATSLTPADPTTTVAVSAEPRLIIPKLNIDVPVHFGISNDTATVMDAMNNGVAHFMIPGATAFPGQVGNLVITGHSAGDIYSNNQYKFIFSGLERLDEGDTIYVNYNSVRYTYSVTGDEVVEPTNVAALTRATDVPRLILVTCTPLGTSKYRLLIFADQINPTTGGSTQNVTAGTEASAATGMPSNEKTFFESIWSFLTGN